MRLTILLVLLIILSAPAPSRAQDDIQSASAVWNDFVAALRRGDYRRAHGLFSAESRQAMPYAQFVSEYGPLSAAREMVLAKPDSLSTRVNGEWAEIGFSGQNPVSGRRFQVGAALVKNQGMWGLVAARNEDRERVEVSARAILAAAAAWRGLPDARERLAALVSGAASGEPAVKFYRFESDGIRLRAAPTHDGLRAFHIDDWGMVRPDAAPSAAPVPDPAPQTVPVQPPPPPPSARKPAAAVMQVPPPPPPPPPASASPETRYGRQETPVWTPSPPPASTLPRVRVPPPPLPEPGEKPPPSLPTLTPPPLPPPVTRGGMPELTEPPPPPAGATLPDDFPEPGLPPLSPPPMPDDMPEPGSPPKQAPGVGTGSFSLPDTIGG